MKVKRVNIGFAIEQKLNELGVSKAEFSRRLGIAQQNVNRILEKENIDTDRLIAISEVLGYNFFEDYISDCVNDEVVEKPDKPVIKSREDVETNINGLISMLDHQQKMEAELRRLAEERRQYMETLLAEKDKIINLYTELLEERKKEGAEQVTLPFTTNKE